MTPLRHWGQAPQLTTNGAITRSPTARPVIPAPMLSTVPMNSWPIAVGLRVGFTPRYGHRSEPQTQEAVTFTTTSVGSWTVG